MSQIVWLNGEFVAAEDARIGVYDGGFLHGAGLFETMRAEDGQVFRLAKHVGRLCSSAEKLIAPVDVDALPGQGTLQELLERNGLREARVRLTVTAGDMLQVGEDGVRHTVCATVSPLSAYPKKFYENGVAVAISRYRQSKMDPLAGHKSTCYLPRLMALRDARGVKCEEALWFTHEHLLAEGSISSVFMVKGGAVRTAGLETPVLPGVARAAVLELCEAQNIKTEEGAITIDDLLDADEVFLTNVIMCVMPVIAVEKRMIGDGKPGAVTKRLMDGLKGLVAKECGTDG